MVRAENPFQLLYVSRLAPDCTWEIVKEIVVTARLSNPAHGITGALLFDGARFCQLIEGDEAEVRALLCNIVRDPRHSDMKILFEAETSAAKSTQRWASGYCESHELEALEAADGPRGQAALLAFVALLAHADLD